MSETDEYNQIVARLDELGLSVFLDLDATEIHPTFWIGDPGEGSEHVAEARRAVADLLEWRARHPLRHRPQGLYQQQHPVWGDVAEPADRTPPAFRRP